MEKIGIALFNKTVGYYESENVQFFYSPEQANSTIRRMLRDEFVKGNVTADWLKEHQYHEVMRFMSKTGEVYKLEDMDEMYVPMQIDCWLACADLEKQDD